MLLTRLGEPDRSSSIQSSLAGGSQFSVLSLARRLRSCWTVAVLSRPACVHQRPSSNAMIAPAHLPSPRRRFRPVTVVSATNQQSYQEGTMPSKYATSASCSLVLEEASGHRNFKRLKPRLIKIAQAVMLSIKHMSAAPEAQVIAYQRYPSGK